MGRVMKMSRGDGMLKEGEEMQTPEMLEGPSPAAGPSEGRGGDGRGIYEG